MDEPIFTPKTGQLDYTNIRRVPVINCVVKHEGRILLVKRSAMMESYPSYWNGVSGFLNDGGSVLQKARMELLNELGVTENKIVQMTEGEVFENKDEDSDRVWIVHPVLVEITADEITLDWKAQEYQWVTIDQARTHRLLPGFGKVLDVFFRKP